jgi:PAS domain S-box-containing protein
MVLERLSRRIETARMHASALQRQAGTLPPSEVAALDQAVEELRNALDELQAAEEQIAYQQIALLSAQAAVERERERYRDLFESAPYAYLVTDPSGIIRESNRAATDLLGVPAHILGNAPLVAHVRQEEVPRFFDLLRRLRETREAQREACLRLRSHDGVDVPVLTTVAPVLDPRGQVDGLRWIIRRSADERDRSRRPVDAEAWYRGLLETVPDAVLVHDLDGRILFANRQVRELFGYSAEELIGQTAEILMPERFRARHVEYRRSYAEAPGVRPMGAGLALYGRRKDGSEFPVDVSLSTFTTDDGLFLTSTIRDLTEKIRADETRARLAAIVETSTDGIISKALDGIVLTWNPGAEGLFGYAASEMIGQTLVRLAPPEAHEEYQMALSQVWQGRRVPSFDTVRLHKDGRRIDVNVSFSPIVDATGAVIAISVIWQDITERRALERLREELLLLTSVELRTPIGAIQSYVLTLKDQLRYDREAVDGIARQSEHLNRLIGDLLDRTLIETGKLSLLRGQFDLLSLVRDCARRADVQGRVGTIRLEAPTYPVLGQWDRDRLEQVVDNLLLVAMRHTAADADAVLRVDDRPASVQISVAVPEPGLPVALLERLFERFPRVEGTLPELGPSLWITRGLVEAHGGHIAVEARQGQGTTFVVDLPRDGAPEPGVAGPVLTPRQIEVVALVARGLTNRDIAESLVISKETVDNHVERILRRLGVRNRVEIARWATERGFA